MTQSYGPQPHGQQAHVPQAYPPQSYPPQAYPQAPAPQAPAPHPAGYPVPVGYAQRPPQAPQWPSYAPQRPQPVNYPPPVRYEPVPGEKYLLAILPVPKMVSGVGVGALVAGIGSILVSFAVWCFGLMGSADGWGGLVGGAFFVLSMLLGIAGVVLGILSLRQIKRSNGGVIGRGYAISGISCGGAALLLAGLGLVVALVLSASA